MHLLVNVIVCNYFCTNNWNGCLDCLWMKPLISDKRVRRPVMGTQQKKPQYLFDVWLENDPIDMQSVRKRFIYVHRGHFYWLEGTRGFYNFVIANKQSQIVASTLLPLRQHLRDNNYEWYVNNCSYCTSWAYLLWHRTAILD